MEPVSYYHIKLTENITNLYLSKGENQLDDRLAWLPIDLETNWPQV